MKDELTLKDFKRFLVENVKIILGSMLAVLLIVSAFVIYAHVTADYSEETESSPMGLTNPPISEERYEEVAEWPVDIYTDSQIDQMQAYLLPRAYKTTIYVEHENYEPVANTTFMREVFRNEEVLEYIEGHLEEELTPAIEFAVHIENLANSGMYELHFQRGTREKSLELGNIITDAIQEGEIPVLENKTVTFINQELKTVMGDYSEYSNGVKQNEGLSYTAMMSDLLIYGVIGLIIGTVVGGVVSLFKMIHSKTITPLYNYERDFTDRIVRLDNLSLDENEVLNKSIQNIIYPSSGKKLVLKDDIENKRYDELFKEIKKENNILIKNDFSELDKDQIVDEVIILSTVNQTLKSWYKSQRVQLNGYDKLIKVIQI